MRSKQKFDDRRNGEASHVHGTHNATSSNDHGVLTDTGDSNDADDSKETIIHGYSQDSKRSSTNFHHRNSNDQILHSGSSYENENWEDLRRLVSDFHYHVDVELPTLLEEHRNHAARMNTNRYHEYAHDETEMSRHHFDLRRCFRNMQELMLREDLWNLLDEEDRADGEENEEDNNDNDDNIDQSRPRCKNRVGDSNKRYNSKSSDVIHGDSDSDSDSISISNSNRDDKKDLFLLRGMFANDLVQLATISDFDDVSGNEHEHEYNYHHGINDNGNANDSGVRELHSSLVVMAADRFPVRATLDDDQISRLLSRVLFLIEQESRSINMHRSRSYPRSNRRSQNHTTTTTAVNPSWKNADTDFEPLQSLLAWLNRETRVERLSRGVLSDFGEAASALQIPLEFLDTMAMVMATKPASVRHSPNAKTKIIPSIILPPQVVLSLRILIDLLLGALQSFVIANNTANGNGNDITSRGSSSNNDNNSDSSYKTSSTNSLSLREWMMAPGHREHRGRRSGSNLELVANHDRLRLMKLLDRYALELVEETMELLRSPRRKLKPPPQDLLVGRPGSPQHCQEQQHGFVVAVAAAGQKRDRHATDSRYRVDFKSEKQRVVTALQHAAMTTNFFSIMEADPTTLSDTYYGKTSVFVGLSRSFWRALARFIIEDVDGLENSSGDDDDTLLYWESYDAVNGGDDEDETASSDIEEYRIAATDVLYRLTKTQVQTILFHNPNRNKNTKNHADAGEKNTSNSNNRHGIKTIPPPRLSEEEFSIIVTTILRLLGHPDEYWTEEHQAWVAALLRVRGDHNHHDDYTSSVSVTPAGAHGVVVDLDVAPKLQKILQAALLCTSYVPDALHAEEQNRVHSSLQELLRRSATNNNNNSATARTCTPQPVSLRKRKYSFVEYPPVGSTATDVTNMECADLMGVDDPWASFWSIRQ